MSRPISSFFNKIPKRAKQLESINLNAVEHKVGDALKLDQQLESTLDNKVELKDAADQFKLKDSLETKKELDTANNDTISSQQGGLLYRDLCKVFEKIENTTKRLEIQQYLTDYFVSVIKSSKSELVTCIYLCLNKLGPEYLGKELGIGEGLLIKAIANSTGRKVSLIKSEMAIKGDLGLIAQSSRSTQKLFSKPKPISITHLFSSLKKISEFTGNQSQQKKIDEIQKLIVAGVEQEPKYLIRSLEGKLRIGLAQQTVLISLAHASVLSKNPKASSDQLQLAVSNLKQVYSTTPNFDTIIPVLLEFGHENLESKCQLTPGVPLKPMLAHPTKSLTEVLDRFEGHSFTCEYKYDGERVQIHKFDDQVQIYSRNSEDLSLKYPDIIARITSLFKNISSFVIDAEAVAFNNESQSILPFQVLSTRKRKNVTEEDIAVQVCVYAFDLLYFEGKSIVQDTFRNRRNLLRTNFQETNGLFMFAKSNDSNVVDDIQTFLDQSIADHCEGLMVKTLDHEASYEPSKRSRNWLKVKKDYFESVGDSLDLVVMGGYTGKGKRTGTYGGYLLGCYDAENEEVQAICKIGTGFSDNDLLSHYTYFKDLVVPTKPAEYLVDDNATNYPDVWFKPQAVWEVKAADLSISPIYKAAIGLVDNEKGISLRFPRFIRVRDDKGVEDATDSTQVGEMYSAQNINVG